MIRTITRVLTAIARVRGRASRSQLDALIVTYSSQPVEALAARLAELRTTTLATALPVREHEAMIDNALAISIVLFDRTPCDLPPGARLYTEQIDAALYLAHGSNVQMDTGEGKTYAVAVAALALTVTAPQVLILTANAYLARRDEARVRAFFATAGVPTGTGLPQADEPGAHYVTLDDICFGYLQRTYTFVDGATYPADAAIIVDELDSVVIDQDRPYATSRLISTTSTDWSIIAKTVSAWDEQHYHFDPITRAVVLTAEGWEQLQDIALEQNRPTTLLFDIADGILWARRAVEGRDYLRVGPDFLVIDSITGLPYKTFASQVGALQYLLDGTPPPIAITVASIDARVLLRRHAPLVGVSGTLIEESLHFLQTLQSWTISVPPRHERPRGAVPNRLFTSRAATIEHVVGRVLDEARVRPLVVACWSVEEGVAVEGAILAAVGDHVTVQRLTAVDDASDAMIARAGERGVVTVINQVGSRGIDIRSRDRPLLLIIGRAPEPRLDRQFLGRVGRHGEAFDAEFLIDPGTELWQFVGNRFSDTFLQNDWVIEGTVLRTLVRGQRMIWLQRVARRHRRTVVDEIQDEVERDRAAAYATARRALASPGGIDALVAHYVDELETNAADATATKENVHRALRARRDHDDVIRELVDELRGISTDGADPRLVFVESDDDHVPEIVEWLQHAPRDALLRDRVRVLGTFRMRTPSIPAWRSPEIILQESIRTWGSRAISLATREVDAVRASSTPETFARRAALVLMASGSTAQDDLPRVVLDNLLHADRPGRLGSLFYAYDNPVSRPAPGSTPPASPTPERARSAPVSRGPSPIELVEAFLAERDANPDVDRSGLARASATAILIPFCTELLSTRTLKDRRAVTRALERFLDRLFVRGGNRSFASAARSLLLAFVGYLHSTGHLAADAVPRPFWRLRLAQIGRYLGTTSSLAVGLGAVELLLIALGCLVTVGGTAENGGEGIAASNDWAAMADRPLLVALACGLAIFAGLCALGLAREVGRASPVIALTGLLGSSVVLAGNGTAVLLVVASAVLTVFWLPSVMAVDQAATSLGFSPLKVGLGTAVIAASFAAALDGDPWPAAVVALGAFEILHPGPRVQVTVGSVDHSSGRSVIEESSALRTILVEIGLRTAFVGFVSSILLGGDDPRSSALVMLVAQAVALVVLSQRKLQADRLKATFGQFKLGSRMTADEVEEWSRRKSIAFPLQRIVPLLVLGWLAVVHGDLSPVELLALQIGGVVAADTARTLLGLAVPVVAQLYVDPKASGERSWTESVRDWWTRVRRGRLRYAEAAIVLLVVYRVLRAVADFADVTSLVGWLLRGLRDLVT